MEVRSYFHPQRNVFFAPVFDVLELFSYFGIHVVRDFFLVWVYPWRHLHLIEDIFAIMGQVEVTVESFLPCIQVVLFAWLESLLLLIIEVSLQVQCRRIKLKAFFFANWADSLSDSLALFLEQSFFVLLDRILKTISTHDHLAIQQVMGHVDLSVKRQLQCFLVKIPMEHLVSCFKADFFH